MEKYLRQQGYLLSISQTTSWVLKTLSFASPDHSGFALLVMFADYSQNWTD